VWKHCAGHSVPVVNFGMIQATLSQRRDLVRGAGLNLH